MSERNDLSWSSRSDRLFLIMALAFVVLFSGLAILRYATFHTGYTQFGLPYVDSWDLGQYHQIVWNSLHGRLLENTYIRDADSFLGKSFTPILLAFVPLYAIWADPRVLLFVQVLAVAAGGLPIYWFARAQVGRPLALFVALCYYLAPAVETMVLVEFHEIVLAAPILAYAAFFLFRRHYTGMIVCLGLALLVKEEIAFVVAAVGVYVFLFQRKWKLGSALFIFGALWAVLLLQYIIPFFRGARFGQTFYYFGSGAIGAHRYDYLGHSLPEAMINILTRPDIVLPHLLVPDKVEYLFLLFAPLAFIPFAGAEVLIMALPTMGYSLLSDYALQYSIHSYYFAPIVPFLFFALVVGLKRLIQWGQALGPGPRNRPMAILRGLASSKTCAILLVVASVSSYTLAGPGPFGRYFEPERYVFDQHAMIGNQLAESIPKLVTVVAQNELLGHVSGRPFVYEMPVADYRQVDYLFADTTKGWYQVHRESWEGFLATGYFEMVANPDGYILARRKPLEQSVQIHFGNLFTLDGYTVVPTDTLRGGMTIHPIVEFRVDTTLSDKYSVGVQVVDGQGHVWAEQDREPQDGSYPTDRWKSGELVGDQFSLRLPPTMPAGDYHLTAFAHKLDDDQNLESYDQSGTRLGTEPILAKVPIEKNKSSVTADVLVKEQPLVELFVDMQEMRFLGYVPTPETVRSGDWLHLGLYWRARAKPRGDYAIVVQLRDAMNRVSFEQSARPANGTYPTAEWDAGEVLLDWHDFVVPGDLAAGDYTLVVALRDLADGHILGQAPIRAISVTSSR